MNQLGSHELNNQFQTYRPSTLTVSLILSSPVHYTWAGDFFVANGKYATPLTPDSLQRAAKGVAHSTYL